eukprot:7381019-Prymnesium_polylepis.1
MHGAPGLLHLLKFGLLQVVYKIYFVPLLHFAGHTVLKRKSITAAAKHYFSCDALYFRVSEALFTLMIEAHKRDDIYKAAAPTLTNLDLYTANFVTWYEAKLRSGDVPFAFYSGFILGVGLLYRMAKQSVSMRDNL